jgi:release factor glutamine methyltransferase
VTGEPDTIVTRLRAAGCVFAEEEAGLLVSSAATGSQLQELVRRRVAGEPLEHLLGWVEFAGLRIGVRPGVFVPRRRSQLLAERAVQLLHDYPAGPAVELCCGSGAISVVLARQFSRLELHATDIEAAAAACARDNLAEHGGAGPASWRVYVGDLYAPLSPDLVGRVAVLIANAPYVPTKSIRLLPPEARLYEPSVTRDGGSDGLAVLRRILADASHWLAPGGHLLVECSPDQAAVLLAEAAQWRLAGQALADDQIGATAVQLWPLNG